MEARGRVLGDEARRLGRPRHDVDAAIRGSLSTRHSTSPAPHPATQHVPIFGYARDCAPEEEELAGCGLGELVESCAFFLNGTDEAGTQQDRVRVVVEADSTFEHRLTAGLTYTLDAIVGSVGSDGVTLEEGEVRYVMFYGHASELRRERLPAAFRPG